MIGWTENFARFEAPPIHPSAKLELWSEAASQLFALGCEAQAFVLLSSFAAPLMELFNGKTREGGAVVAIHGGRKAGKSVALSAAATVWGMPGLMTTSGRSMGIFSALRHLPAFATGLANGDPDIVAAYVRNFLSGGNYATVLLSSSGEELPRMKGVIQLVVKVPRGLIAPDKTTPSALERKLLDNRTAAGAAYLRVLTQPDVLAWARKALASKYALQVDELGLDHEWRFQIRAIAAAWVAGEIAARAKILECNPERIARWVMQEALLP